MKQYLVIDTNVIVSSLLKPISNPGTIVRESMGGQTFVPVVSPKIINEYRAVLKREKFHFDPIKMDKLVDRIAMCSMSLDDRSFSIYRECSHFNDQKFFDLLLNLENHCNNSYLVTGNLKHYPVKDNIVNPKKMCEIANLL